MAAKRLWYWGPVFGYAGLIFYLSSLPNPTEDLPIPDLGDKALHVIEYAVLGALCFRAFRWDATQAFARQAVVLAVIASSLYGFSDELHQALVPMRESSWLDVLADLVGAGVGATLAAGLYRGSWKQLFIVPRDRPLS